MLIEKMDSVGIDLSCYSSRRIWPVAYTKSTLMGVYAEDAEFTKERVDIRRPKADELGLSTLICFNSVAASSRISIGDLEFFPCEKQLRRIFTDEHGTYNGRLYGPLWQNISSQARPFIEIDGEKTVEVDISSAHPLIAYAREGFDLTEIVKREGRPYELDALDTDNMVVRKLVKQALLTMFNASSKAETVRALNYFMGNDPWGRVAGNNYSLALSRLINGKGLSEYSACEWIVDRLIEKHHRISSYFFTESWKVLNREESNICLDVVGHFSNTKGVLVLPVHDSFVIPFSEVQHGVLKIRESLHNLQNLR